MKCDIQCTVLLTINFLKTQVSTVSVCMTYYHKKAVSTSISDL